MKILMIVHKIRINVKCFGCAMRNWGDLIGLGSNGSKRFVQCMLICKS